MFRPLAWLSLALCAAAAAVPHHHEETTAPPALTAAASGPTATLVFRIQDERAGAIPGRLTFVREDGSIPDLFPNTDVLPNELAIRKNIIYTVSGSGAVTVPAGRFTVYASRGLEWSIDRSVIEFVADGRVEWTATLKHEIDTSGWISGDFHLHTLTHSGHGDANLKERVITFVGEGLEFAVATDHNHNTDYEPVVRELGLERALTTVVGNEVSTDVGHFNAFPLDPARPIPPPRSYDANHLFKLIRKEPNRYGVTPVIQLNHPRWGTIDYFGRAGLDPVRGIGTKPTYSEDFDTIEIFNENEGWGYYDADTERDIPVAQSKHSVLFDWFNLLNRGHRYAAVGNSDSHNVQSELAAYPRNFVRSPTDDAAAIRTEDVANALRNQQVFTTIGPFVDFTINGESMGGLARAADGAVDVQIRIQAASWIDCDRVKIVRNGDVIEELPVPQTRTPLRLDIRRRVVTPTDGWITLLIEGDDPLHPIVQNQDRPIRPLAVMNPVRIDADGDGEWRSPWQQAQARAAEAAVSAELLASLPPREAALLVLAAAETKPADRGFVASALRDERRPVRMAGARAAELLADAALQPELALAGAQYADDHYWQISLLRARAAGKDTQLLDAALAVARSAGGDAERYREDLEALLPGGYVTDWRAVGVFRVESADARTRDLGPEADPNAPDYAAAADARVAWKPLRANRGGYLNLKSLAAEGTSADDCIAYAECYIQAATDSEVRFALGADDGVRCWVNGELVIDDPASHKANPLQHVGTMKLRAGWNRVLAKVHNRKSDFGLYLRLLADGVKTSPQPE